ncbi:hypothetical protein PoB_004049500 [Plakobranchus ocellatus]|uniref:FZ domain-containing protein n=1 Tax=Plakobranchus ocellatus TaxID=259542 RepID=A0AAV4B056_9GAST|nr:hypothetical protein PoB_004049500 [Plakobranchus ocellatus]
MNFLITRHLSDTALRGHWASPLITLPTSCREKPIEKIKIIAYSSLTATDCAAKDQLESDNVTGIPRTATKEVKMCGQDLPSCLIIQISAFLDHGQLVPLAFCPLMTGLCKELNWESYNYNKPEAGGRVLQHSSC